MMEWSAAFDAGRAPTMDEITAFVRSPLLGRLHDHLAQAYNSAPQVEYSSCSAQPGWNIKYKKGQKALCTVYPMDGYFITMVSVSPKNEPNAELMLPSLSAYTQQLFKGARALPRMGRWLMMEIRDDAVLDDALRLIDMKFAK